MCRARPATKLVFVCKQRKERCDQPAADRESAIVTYTYICIYTYNKFMHMNAGKTVYACVSGIEHQMKIDM